MYSLVDRIVMAVSVQTILTFPAAILYYRAAAAPFEPNFVCLGEETDHCYCVYFRQPGYSDSVTSCTEILIF